MGTQWTAVVLAATGPVLVGVLRDASGGYQSPFALLTLLFLAAAAVIVAGGRAKPSHDSADHHAVDS